MNLVRMTWEWMGFEAYVIFFKWGRCAGLWEVLEGRLIGGQVGGGRVLAEAGGRRRRECGRVERLFLGSSSVVRAHNLSS